MLAIQAELQLKIGSQFWEKGDEDKALEGKDSKGHRFEGAAKEDRGKSVNMKELTPDFPYFKHRKEDEEIPVMRQLKTRITPEEIKEKVGKEIEDKRLARKLGIYLSRKYSGRKIKEIANMFGKIGDTGASQIYWRVEKARKNDNSFDTIIKRLEKKIMSNVET